VDCAFTHEAIRDWEARFSPLIKDRLRSKRQEQAGKSWYVDETSVKVHGKWCSLYRAIDHDGHLVDSMFRFSLNIESAQHFLKRAVAVVGHIPDQVTTDGHHSYPRAIREAMSNNITHRMSNYLNNRLEPGSPWDQTTILSDARF
jgi:transposase-like protein